MSTTLIQPFNARQFDPTQGVGGLPIGKHPVVVAKAEVKPSKNNDGGYLQLDLQVTGGDAQGAVGAYRLNLYHSSEQTVQIAHKQLSAVCHVTGVMDLQDAKQLYGIPFVVEVGLQKEPNPNKYTEVKRVFDINGNEPGQQGQPQAQQPQQQPQQAAQPAAGGWGGQPQAQQQPAAQQPAQQPAPAAGGWQQPAGNVANNVPMPGNAQPAQQPAPQPGWGQQPQGGNGQTWGQQPAGNGQPQNGQWGQR